MYRKSKLRKPQEINLGKQYAGSQVSRDALDAESDDDPFKARSDDEDSEDDDEEGVGLENGEDEESDSQEASEESEDEKPKQTKKSKQQQLEADSEEDEVDGMETGSDDIEGSEEGEDGLEDDDMDSEGSQDDESEDDDDEEETNRGDKSGKSGKSDDREELRQLMATDQKTIAASISQAAKSDAAKGKAVKQQRSTFDSLLNTRIKLQKGLTAMNQLSVAAKDADDVDREAVKSAESAALSLWSTLEDLRYALADAQSGESKKRKRPSPVSSTTSSDSLWKRMADLESDSVAHRRAILDKWSLKVRGSSASGPNARGKLLGSSSGGQQTITAVLDAQLASEAGERSTKRARKQAANGDQDDEPIYDDTVFYQTLLRELVEQRMSSDSITNGLDTLHIQLPSRLSLHPVTGMRNDKNKRRGVVDTRATKGRKMKYDVHEKLQNFMAPEDRGTWTTRARDEFFASLLGRTASGVLGEDDEEASAAEESDEDRQEGGLRLFRS